MTPDIPELLHARRVKYATLAADLLRERGVEWSEADELDKQRARQAARVAVWATWGGVRR